MEFANATYLWGLLGLLVPIAIHLWSRKKVVTIKIGSIKFLETSEPKQTSSIKLNEWWLLFLRMLILFLLVLIISEPSTTKSQENIPVSYVIESSLIGDNRLTTLLDTLTEGSIRLLEKGFPQWDGTTIATAYKTLNYWQLAREMQSIASDSIVVFSQGFLKGIHGSRPSIQANTKWMVLEPTHKIVKELAANHKDQYVEVLTLRSDAHALSFKKDSLSLNSEKLEINLKQDSVELKSSTEKNKIALGQNSPIRVAVVYEDSLEMQYQYVKAAYGAISKFLNQPFEIAVLKDLNTLNTINFNTVVSFSDVIPNDSHATLLIFKPDALAKNLIEKGPTQNIFYLTQLLDSENIVKEQLPEQLLRLLYRQAGIEKSILSNDLRVLAEEELQPFRSNGEGMVTKARVLYSTPWLWLLLIGAVVLERILSKLRKQ